MLAEYRVPLCAGAIAMVWARTGRAGLSSVPATLEHAVVRLAARITPSIGYVLMEALPLQLPARNPLSRSRTPGAPADIDRPSLRARPAFASHRTRARPADEIDRS